MMQNLYEIFENESQDKAYLIFVLVALKMTEKVYHNLPENLQQIVQDATNYWTNNSDYKVSKQKMEQHATYVSKLRSKSPNRNDINSDLNIKLVELSLNPTINYDYFDYHLDWMYEIGSRLGFNPQKLNDLITQTINETE